MFDYIIIGAGSSGCAVAARLSEDPRNQVLLIEAGPPDRDRAVRTPLLFPKLFRTPLDWQFWTEPQEQLEGRRLYWPRGRTIGGSGSINAMVQLDACRADLDHWRDLGNVGWGYDDLRPLVENSPMSASPVPRPNPLSDVFLQACESSGVPRVSELVDASAPAAGPFRVDIRNGVRWTSADAYLRPALQRGNLTVWTGIHVRRVVFADGETPRAVGVEYSQDGELRRVNVVQEILLCAGTVGSPQLLMLSGVGDPDHLAELGIPLVAALRGVGENLQDHLAAPVSFFCTRPVSLCNASTFLHRLQHRLHSTGPLASNGAEAGALLRSRSGATACDLEVIFAPVHFVDHGFAQPGGHGFSLVPALLTPQSRGRIRLATSSSADAPLIDPRYLTSSVDATATGKATNPDLAALMEGVRFVQRLAQQPAFAQHRGKPVLGHGLDSDEQIRTHIRTWGQTLYHPVGTCRMGPTPDTGKPADQAVVDEELCVYGVTGLRVVDASIMPTIPRANTNATCLLIAEKAATLLKRP